MAKKDNDKALLSQELTALTVRGIAATLFGLVALFWPGLTLVTLVYVFSAYVIVNGIIGLVWSVTSMRSNKWWFLDMLLSGVELGIGVFLVRHITVTLATFILLVGIVLAVRGVVEIVRAIVEPGNASKRTLSGIAGVLSLLAGIIVLREPVSGGLAFVWVLGLYALLVGPLLIALSVDARNALEV